MPLKNIKFLKTSHVKLAFTNKAMTSYGGFSVIAKLFESIELRKHVEAMFPFIEVSPNATGVFSKVLRFGLTVLAGGRRFSHTMFLGDSLEIYEAIFSVKRITKSISSVTRFFNRVKSFQAVEYVSDRLWRYTIDRIIPWHKVKSDYLTLDSTVVTRYGEQEGACVGYNPKKRGRPSHHPLLAFLNKNQFVVNLWNRPGNTSSFNNCLEFAKQTWARLEGKLKILGVLCDSAFYQEAFLKFVDDKKVPFTIAVVMHKIIQQQIAQITDWKKVDNFISVCEFGFRHDKWERFRRYIVVRQEVSQNKKATGKQLSLFEKDPEISRYRYGCYSTSHTETPEEIWRTYRLRASDEGVIRESKYDFALDGFSLDCFYAVETAMLFRVLFYNIVQSFRLQVLPDSEKGETLHTLRMKYLLIPSVLGRDGKEIILRLGVRAKKMKQKILWILAQIDNQIPKRIAFGPAF
ncbi:MAG: IS1380 family transposase [Deltaproteobacteria bacterium]|nr:IS1380 family transposase [Deltaproteobacteria bacterium]